MFVTLVNLPSYLEVLVFLFYRWQYGGSDELSGIVLYIRSQGAQEA